MVLCWPRMAKDLLQVVSVTTFMAILCFHFVHVLSCSICTLFFGTHVITQTQDIMTGVLVGNDAKETYKNTQGGKEKESLQKGCLKINEAEKKKQGTRSCCLTK